MLVAVQLSQHCFTMAYGMGSGNGGISSRQLVNFDMNVVAPNGAIPITYSWPQILAALPAINTPAQPVGQAPAVKGHA